MTAAATPEVLVIGSSNTDLVISTERLPTPGETLLGGAFFRAAGGKGANQAVAAARAGAHVTLVARTGRDGFGQGAIEGLRKEGIDTSCILADPDLASGVAFILVDAQGENSIVVASGANAALSPVQIDAATPAFARADICLLQLETPLETVSHAVGLAAEHNLPVILNPAPARELPPEILSGLFLLTPNESETEILTGIRPHTEDDARQAAKILQDRGVEAVLITLGARGSLLFTARGVHRISTPEVEARDTTAAGDAFNGALACALGSGASLEEAAGFASTAGALAVTRQGAQPSLPTRDQIVDLMGG